MENSAETLHNKFLHRQINKITIMDKKDNQQLEPQDAPLKNTDKAFVRVSEDGSPEMPDEGKQDGDNNDDKERFTTLDHR
jgi:hypothetical protein